MDPDGDGDPRDGIDGWQLDVPNEVPAPFWVEWAPSGEVDQSRRLHHRRNLGRVDALLDGHFDAVMNYRIAQQAVAWIGHKPQDQGQPN